MDPSNRCFYTCWTGSETSALYTYDASETLDDRLYSYMAEGNYAKGVLDWIDNMGSYLKTGRMPKTTGGWIWVIILSAGVGAIVGGITTGKAKRAMNNKKKAVNANAYMERDSVSVRSAGDFLLSTTTVRHKISSPSSHPGGGSSHHSSSSHSSSYHGHSGSSHSGSGRHF